MLDILLEHVKNHITGILQNEKLPEGVKSEDIAHEASAAIFTHLKTNASKGNIDEVMQMFSGETTHALHPTLKYIKLHLVERIRTLYKLEEKEAEEMVSKFLPSVMNLFNTRVAEGALDMESIVSQFKGSSVSNVVENSNKAKHKVGRSVFNIFASFFKK